MLTIQNSITQKSALVWYIPFKSFLSAWDERMYISFFYISWILVVVDGWLM